MEKEKIHLYFRDMRGRIITHFLFPKKDWDLIEDILKVRNITFNDLLYEWCTEQLSKEGR